MNELELPQIDLEDYVAHQGDDPYHAVRKVFVTEDTNIVNEYLGHHWTLIGRHIVDHGGAGYRNEKTAFVLAWKSTLPAWEPD